MWSVPTCTTSTETGMASGAIDPEALSHRRHHHRTGWLDTLMESLASLLLIVVLGTLVVVFFVRKGGSLGFLDSLKSAETRYLKALTRWEEEREHVKDVLYMAEHLDEVYQASANELGGDLRTKPGEHMLLSIEGSSLVEPRRTAGSYQGGSAGVSFRVAKGVSFRVGQHRGTFVPGPEEQTVIDQGGRVFITTQRVVFVGPRQSREWAFSKMLSLSHDGARGATYIQVSNRQKTSGFVYGPSLARSVQDRLTLALAVFDNETEYLASQLRDQLKELDGSKPDPPPPE